MGKRSCWRIHELLWHWKKFPGSGRNWRSCKLKSWNKSDTKIPGDEDLELRKEGRYIYKDRINYIPKNKTLCLVSCTANMQENTESHKRQPEYFVWHRSWAEIIQFWQVRVCYKVGWSENSHILQKGLTYPLNKQGFPQDFILTKNFNSLTVRFSFIICVKYIYLSSRWLVIGSIILWETIWFGEKSCI